MRYLIRRRIVESGTDTLDLDPHEDAALIVRLREAGYLIFTDEEATRNLKADLVTTKVGYRGVSEKDDMVDLEESATFKIQGKTVIIEACDGLWGLFTNAQVAQIIKGAKSAVEIRDRLLTAAVELTSVIRPGLKNDFMTLKRERRKLLKEDEHRTDLDDLEKRIKDKLSLIHI